jgi:hypothetical protein
MLKMAVFVKVRHFTIFRSYSPSSKLNPPKSQVHQAWDFWGAKETDLLRSQLVQSQDEAHRIWRLTWKIWDWTFPNMDLVQNIGVFHSKIAGLSHPSY